MPLFGRNEDLHCGLACCLGFSFSFYAFPSILSTCAGQEFSKQFPKLPNKQRTKWSSLSQPSMNPLPGTHHLINTHHSKDSIKQRKRIFIINSSSWLSMHPPVFLLPNTQASFCNPAFHWSDPRSSQTIIIVSLNLQRIRYTPFHQYSLSSKRRYQAKKEDLHRQLVIVHFSLSFLMFSTQAFVSPLDTTATQGFNIRLHASLPYSSLHWLMGAAFQVPYSGVV
jgi:hypothetical protein